MTLHSTVQRVLDLGLVAILRAERGEQLPAVARAIRDGGIDVIEVTLTVPDALEIIRTIRRELGPDVLLGAGTVLDPESARLAMLAGAEFIVTPTVNLDVVAACRRYGTPCLMGAYTPTEILTAWQAGADLIKVFPAEIGGPDYLKAIRGPLPQIPLVPTGGVTLETIGRFFQAGAAAVGLGSSLLDKEALVRQDYQRIEATAAAFVAKVKECRR